MVVLFNLCQNFGEEYQINPDEDKFCPFCGTSIEIPKSLISGASRDSVLKTEYDKLYKKFADENVKAATFGLEVEKLNKKIGELNAEIKQLKEKNDKLKLSKSGDISEVKLDTEGKTNTEIFMQFIVMPKKKGVNLPQAFRRVFLNLSGNYILDGNVGVDTEVYLCADKKIKMVKWKFTPAVLLWCPV